MAFPRFSFSTTYEDTNQFPTGPRAWRTFLQQLHNETKDYLVNTLGPWMDSLERHKVKSGCYAKANANQAISATTFTKVNYAAEVKDYNTEYDPTTSTFTVKTAGLYQIDGCIGWQSPGATNRSFLEVWVNGAAVKRISEGMGVWGNAGATVLDLAVSDAVTLRAYTSNALSTDGATNATGNYFTVTKIG